MPADKPDIICVPIHVTGVQNRKAAAQRKMETLNSMMNGFLNKKFRSFVEMEYRTDIAAL